MIGAVTYSGDSWRGHYQGAIRLGQLWWIQDDNVKPISSAVLPEWCNHNLSHIWLLGAEQTRDWAQIMALPELDDDGPTEEVAMAMAAVRTILQT